MRVCTTFFALLLLAVAAPGYAEVDAEHSSGDAHEADTAASSHAAPGDHGAAASAAGHSSNQASGHNLGEQFALCGQHVIKPRFRQFVCFGMVDSNCSPADRRICVLN